jgi:acyl-homoserine-lactone acylase
MTRRSLRNWLLGCGLLMLAAAAVARTDAAPPVLSPGVEIRRTTDGIPHLRADSWHALGRGVGYVQAQDALCTLAEAFVTYAGRRSWFFGTDGRPARDSTFGRPKNIDLDFFFRAFADDTVLSRYRQQHPRELNELVEGFAAGYNRYLADAREGRVQATGRRCLNKSWVREITADDIHRRMYAAQIAAGYAKFIPEIANARPAKAVAVFDVREDDGAGNALRDRLAHRIGTQPGIGSNALAFGREATGGDGAVLFGNPHWYWSGPDRFYQMHLTIPGRLDVAGVAFLGVPVVMIGFNAHVAWTHTVSEARRFGLFDLALDPADPTRYRVDGQLEPMTAREVGVDVRAAPGGARKARRLTRTFYRTRFGPVLDLGGHHEAFGWGTAHALAVRDINAGNFRIFRNFFYWNQAKSLDDFIAIQRREGAVPWVNTVAMGRGDGRVWYGDVGAVPNAPDDLREGCATPLAKAFATVDARTPVLDGSRSACNWRIDPAAVQAGAMPGDKMPWLLREDYVANMNDSHWLSNARQPLEGFASLLGGEREPLSLRGRLGHRMALDLLEGSAPSADALGRRLMRDVLTPRAHSAELFKDEVLAQACTQPRVRLDAAALKAAGLAKAPAAAREIDVGPACEVLRRWSGRADAADRGALLWDALWSRLAAGPAAERHGVPFSSEAPLDTPRGFRAGEGEAARALAATVAEFGVKGLPLDEAVGSRRFVLSGGQRFPLYGGCHSRGYFTVACNEEGGDRMGPDSLANSYLQVVRFGASGVEAHTLLAHGQDEAAVAGGAGQAPVARYAQKNWLRFPFREEEIAADAQLKRMVLRP